jgi:DNA-binding NarL/FixJ family response regulator
MAIYHHLHGSQTEITNRPRVLIADDHLLVAEAYKRLLESEFEIVGVVTDGRELIDSAGELRPDVILVDVAMPCLNGLDACEQIKTKDTAVRIIFVTMTDCPELAAEAFRRGASGFVTKCCGADELHVAVRRVLLGESYLSPMITEDTLTLLLRPNQENRKNKSISLRQREIVQLLAEGESMKEVAYRLNLRPGTVAFHKYKMMKSLGIKTNAELVEYAMSQHMIAN